MIVINGYNKELECINNIGENTLAQIVGHAQSAQEDMHHDNILPLLL